METRFGDDPSLGPGISQAKLDFKPNDPKIFGIKCPEMKFTFDLLACNKSLICQDTCEFPVRSTFTKSQITDMIVLSIKRKANPEC